MFEKSSVSGEVLAVMAVLDSIDTTEQGFSQLMVFPEVKKKAKERILKHAELITKLMVKNKSSPEAVVYAWIANVSGDMLESGEYHVYRGIVDILGEQLLEIFDIATDKYAAHGEIDAVRAAKEKEAIRQNIKMMG